MFRDDELVVMHEVVCKELDKVSSKGVKKYKQKSIGLHRRERVLINIAYKVRALLYKKLLKRREFNKSRWLK